MKRRETYATTGSRMSVRFFGGWDFEQQDTLAHDFAAVGYRKGVPMGGRLTGDGQRRAPTFIVAAQRDPVGANLDRLQIVKGWVNADGKTQEQVYNIAWSGKREIAADGRLPSVGSTIDYEAASYTNSIGAPQLVAAWTDPDFDPEIASFYYVRVLEIPTPRWPLYDGFRLGAELPEEARLEIQDRA